MFWWRIIDKDVHLRRYGETVVIHDKDGLPGMQEVHMSVAAFKELQKVQLKDIPK